MEDGYTIDEVLEQVTSALGDESKVLDEINTVLCSSQERKDSAGRMVRDEAVFECTQKYPHPELWSVIPKGDGKRLHRKS